MKKYEDTPLVSVELSELDRKLAHGRSIKSEAVMHQDDVLTETSTICADGQDCRSCHAPGCGEARDDTGYPLDVQESVFESRFHDACERLADRMRFERRRLFGIARERLRSGYRDYGSRMFGFSDKETVDNIDEELADAILYFIANPGAVHNHKEG